MFFLNVFTLGVRTGMSMSIQQQIATIEVLCRQLETISSLKGKIAVLEAKAYQDLEISSLIKSYDEHGQYVLLCAVAIGQGSVIFRGAKSLKNVKSCLDRLVKVLCDLDLFYNSIGGVVGYHLSVLKLIDAKNSKDVNNGVNYEEPEGLDVSLESREVRQSIRWGIEHLPEMAEIYPIGGAGDRLGLHDRKNDEDLPAALLLFCGRNLLEGLIRDLQGREFLYYKLCGKQVVTPVAMMTSYEKNNRKHIMEICEESHWFHRPKISFDVFVQIMVPMLTTEGDWVMTAPFTPLLKPGGHGVLWKTAQDAGVFDRLKKQQRTKLLIRQINNPIAGIDNGLLSLFGLGCHQNKSFGFASCPRIVGAAEGMNVLREEKNASGYSYCITNVEYTDFTQKNIKDFPHEKGGVYSRFPANTNVLFAEVSAVEEALKKCPVPGLVVNMKSSVKCYLDENLYEEKKAARLESTMQNLADEICDQFASELSPDQYGELKTFITYNKRRKTLSSVKELDRLGEGFNGTPIGCFYDLMDNYRELLSEHCGMRLPAKEEIGAYWTQGPVFVTLFHPALGGLYSVIGQKIRGGSISRGSEWVMEIAEAEIVDLNLEGSLIVRADAIMGKTDSSGIIVYDSGQCGKCSLINVNVRNQGMKTGDVEAIWERNVDREECLEIILHGNGEFFAQDVTFIGNVVYDVPDGHRLVVYQENGKIRSSLEKIDKSTWMWHYMFDVDNRIHIYKE